VFTNTSLHSLGTGYYFLPLLIELFPFCTMCAFTLALISSLKFSTDLFQLSVPCSLSLFSMFTVLVKLLSGTKCKIISTGMKGYRWEWRCGSSHLILYPLKSLVHNHAPPAPFSFKDKPVPLVATVRLCISYHYSVTLTG